MRGILIKDILILNAHKKLALLLLVPLFTEEVGIRIMIGSMMSYGIALTIMAMEEQVKWDDYVRMLPVRARDIVLSKYIISILCGTLATVIVVGLQAGAYHLFGYGLEYAYLLEAVLGIAASFFLLSIALPICFWFGIQQSRIVFFLVYFVILFFASKISWLNIPSMGLSFLLGIVCLLGIGCIVCSVLLAVKLYEKKCYGKA